MHNLIFFTNVLRILEEKGMTKTVLAEKAGMSVSFLSDLTNGKANPSLKIMEAIAEALDAPLLMLLEANDLDSAALSIISGAPKHQGLPKGYVHICAVLPEAKAFIVRKWEDDAKKTINEKLKQ